MVVHFYFFLLLLLCCCCPPERRKHHRWPLFATLTSQSFLTYSLLSLLFFRAHCNTYILFSVSAISIVTGLESAAIELLQEGERRWQVVHLSIRIKGNCRSRRESSVAQSATTHHQTNSKTMKCFIAIALLALIAVVAAQYGYGGYGRGIGNFFS